MRGLNEWDISRAKLVHESFHSERCAAHGFRKGDIIAARKGRLGLERRPPEISKYVFSHTVFIIRPTDTVLPNYLLWFLRQDACVTWLLQEMNSNTGVPTLGKGYMERLPAALPPMDEQREIGRRIDALFALADRLENHYVEAKVKVDRLTEGILSKAFRGELVPPEDRGNGSFESDEATSGVSGFRPKEQPTRMHSRRIDPSERVAINR